MASPLVSRLRAARHAQFVGRSAELELFRSLLNQSEPPFSVLYTFGPGGVGKTALLGEFAFLCDQSGSPATYVDSRNVEPSPDSFLGALRAAMGLVEGEHPLQALGRRPARHFLLIDTAEVLAPLDQWILTDFLPQLPEHAVVVLAGRNPPSLAWRADPGWQALTRVLPLRNLSPEESRAYLIRRAVPADQHQAITQFTHGHPLALSLVADTFAQRGNVQFKPEAAPDVVKLLLEQLVQQVPSTDHRRALEACAIARLTTEGLLAGLLAMTDVHELFEWLRGLSFIESGPMGLFPHDLTRDALAADLRWRDPDWYAELHKRARTFYRARLQQISGEEQQGLLFDYIFLHRDNLVIRPFFEWQESGGALLPDIARDTDRPAVLAMVAKHEGGEAALLAERWLIRYPQAMVVFRDAQQEVVGFLAMLPLHQLNQEDLVADPAIVATWRYLQSHAPLRPGESAFLYRFWMARDTYQDVSPVQSLIVVRVVQQFLTTPGLAYTFFPCADPEFWALAFAYADLEHIPEAGFQVGGRSYSVFGHDWRAVPPMAWLEVLAEREIAMGLEPEALKPSREPLLVLSQPDFTAAVRDTLRNLTRPDALDSSPLLRSRLVVAKTGATASVAERVAALRSVVREAAESLQAPPREATLYRALFHTYLQPAPTQERAAELLDMPFSTFRRHLNAGIARVTETLWHREIGA